jgi:hypothetical protein
MNTPIPGTSTVTNSVAEISSHEPRFGVALKPNEPGACAIEEMRHALQYSTAADFRVLGAAFGLKPSEATPENVRKCMFGQTARK